ncbi:hypothetical protein [uncultured Sphingomonas sp.]|jgi:hypothetical protein|uniref:hypothetical protein n=1 Tax=uncultured Sphingomonas sp. TaxID=158754 RepID=UPI0025DA134E|nr:hypothetical protein [uncultured Sphingomonas sp.]
MALLIEAGQMTASDYVPIYPDLPLASEGASTEVIRSAQPFRSGHLMQKSKVLHQAGPLTITVAVE